MMTDSEFAGAFGLWLGDMWRMNPRVALQVIAAFVDEAGAGVPEYSFLQGRIRDDARYWADTAQPHELECYIAAGLERVKETAFAPRMRKRMVGTIWRKMTAAEKAEFLEWAKNE